MRPFITLNAAASIDGKITTAARDLHGFGGPEDRELMDTLRAAADAVLIGAGTLRDEDPTLSVHSTERVAARRAAGRPDQPLAVVVSRSLDFPVAGTRFFTAPGVTRLVVSGNDAPADRVRRLDGAAEVVSVSATADGLDLGQAVAQLATRGVKNLLLEGGGGLNFAMLAAGLVDRIHLTVCPYVFGGATAPTAFGGGGFATSAIRPVTLVSVREGQDGRLFLTYQVGPDTPRGGRP